MEASLGSDNLGTSLDVYDTFINDNVEDISKGYNEEDYQGLSNFLKIYDVIYNIKENKEVYLYDQYDVYGVVIPYYKGEKLMGECRNCIKYEDFSTG